ncbi:modular serine protease-like [Maniola jurtina]|uniref:modular serine protease-like n=1 Tax=Maniola jurtina TaxID=191418 RepID=UPI001E68A1D7|nr:modular serine protease-like [Maniola jurtina]
MFQYTSLVFLVFIFTNPVSTAVVDSTSYLCSADEYACGDGTCIGLASVCDGTADCVDQSDEGVCSGQGHTVLEWDRVKRQASSCRKNQWQCRDGSCIGFDGKCDGAVDCPDASDETFPLCRKTQCQSNWFRCTYGACVDGSAPCNGVRDCADNSDELLPRCRNETDETRGRFKCKNGQVISSVEHCDGVRDCADGSDETLETCAAKTCPGYLFQCAYGACVDQGSDCNGVKECADGSDESDELCNRISPGVKPVTPTPTPPTNKPSQGGNCKLPSYPQFGTYTVTNVPGGLPGESYTSVFLNITCNPGFGVEEMRDNIWCYNGVWSNEMPKCVRFCRLNKHPSVEYRCISTGAFTGSRECGPLEPAGTIVQPICRTPNYYYPGVLSNMNCIDGYWDYIALCKPECGTITPLAKPLIIGGRTAKKGELPWHTGIYDKMYNPYMQVCGGSLISTNAVISAAHCFWSDSEKKLPAANYAVAVGKLYRPWNNVKDEGAQKSDVAEIKLTPRYQGAAANYQDDIAIVLVVTPFVYQPSIRPVCINFDVLFDLQQMTPGTMGKVAGWGLTTSAGGASQILKVVEMPVVAIDECRARSPVSFRVHLTSDKICAGYTNGTTLCQGDSGGGLAFPAVEQATERHYLRGVVSVSPVSDDACNQDTLVAFTQVTKHEHFIKPYL